MKKYKEILGNATWKFLHTLAQGYVDNKPTIKQLTKIKLFLDLLADIYPCEVCAVHFKTLLQRNPLTPQSTLNQYLCHIHNLVNVRLGKETFSCKSI